VRNAAILPPEAACLNVSESQADDALRSAPPRLPRQKKAHSGVDSATTENATYFTSSRLILDLSFLGFFFSRFGASLLPISK
jgi:hypothetical protein